jgi:hypothetical protein
MSFNPSQAFGAFAGVLAIGAVSLLTGAATPPSIMPTLDVQRINIREPDGTIRMVISNVAEAPGAIIDGQDHPRPDRRVAGMLFFNDEGTENGGLVFGGQRDASGTVHSHGSLTFDRYKQDQVVQIFGDEDGADRSAGIGVYDHPEKLVDQAMVDLALTLDGEARQAAYRAANVGGAPRAFVGRAEDGSSQIVLEDAEGIKRLRLRVAADGAAAIEFLDRDGKVLRTIDGRRE